jgi:hypothetical protein
MFISLFGSDRFISTNDICSHGLSEFFISPFFHPNVTIKKSKFKNEVPWITTHRHLFSYIKGDMRDRERKKKRDRRETEEIKNEIRQP